MGYDHTLIDSTPAARQEFIANLNRETTWSHDGKTFRQSPLAVSRKGSVVWALMQTTTTQANGSVSTETWIRCTLISFAKARVDTWGVIAIGKSEASSKEMSADMHPFFYTCPISFIDRADAKARHPVWERIVRERATAMRQALINGRTYRLIGLTIPEITVIDTQKRLGTHAGRTYRLPARSRFGAMLDLSPTPAPNATAA